MRLAITQMTSTNNLRQNLTKMWESVKEAAAQKANVIVFPEMAYFMGSEEERKPTISRFNEITGQFRDWASALNIWIHAGSLAEPSLTDRHYNTAVLVSPKEGVVYQYRKMHLFGASLPDRNYNEAKRTDGGSELSVIETPWGRLGTAICFDLRFPELFRRLRKLGAQVVIIPSSFTVSTGNAHWEILLRARAIENQCFIVAPAQVGKIGNGFETWGHSMVVSPWGEVMADLGGTLQGMHFVNLDLNDIEKYRKQIDVWKSQRADVFTL